MLALLRDGTQPNKMVAPHFVRMTVVCRLSTCSAPHRGEKYPDKDKRKLRDRQSCSHILSLAETLRTPQRRGMLSCAGISCRAIAAGSLLSACRVVAEFCAGLPGYRAGFFWMWVKSCDTSIVLPYHTHYSHCLVIVLGALLQTHLLTTSR